MQFSSILKLLLFGKSYASIEYTVYHKLCTTSQCGPGSNGNEKGTPHFPSLGNRVHCLYLHFCFCCFFLHTILSKMNNFERNIFDSYIGTTTPGQSGSGSNGNEELLSRSSELEAHYQMQFIAILRTLIFFGGGWKGIQSVYFKPHQPGAYKTDIFIELCFRDIFVLFF